MPIYFNEHVSIRGSYSNYNSGRIGRTYRTEGGGHFEAPLEISAGIMRKIGPISFSPGLSDDFTVMEDSTYSGYYLAARSTKSKKYSVITLDLYTVGRKQNLKTRRDAVLMRREDANRVEVLLGGGYLGRNGERSYDNIILRARAGAIIVIQNNRSDHFRLGDQFFRVSGKGVERGYFGLTDMSAIGDFSKDIAADWIYI